MNSGKDLKILNINFSLYKTRLSKKFIERKPYTPVNPGQVVSFIPGTVIDLLVSEGQVVDKGRELIILDAMKMQNRLKAAIGGTVRKILVSRGDKVSKGTLLIELE